MFERSTAQGTFSSALIQRHTGSRLQMDESHALVGLACFDLRDDLPLVLRAKQSG